MNIRVISLTYINIVQHIDNRQMFLEDKFQLLLQTFHSQGCAAQLSTSYVGRV